MVMLLSFLISWSGEQQSQWLAPHPVYQYIFQENATTYSSKSLPAIFSREVFTTPDKTDATRPETVSATAILVLHCDTRRLPDATSHAAGEISLFWFWTGKNRPEKKYDYERIKLFFGSLMVLVMFYYTALSFWQRKTSHFGTLVKRSNPASCPLNLWKGPIGAPLWLYLQNGK